MLNPRWLKPYTYIVLTLSVLMIVLYLAMTGFFAYMLSNPLITKDPATLTYNMMKSEHLHLALSEENSAMFAHASEKDFKARQPYFHKIALEDQGRYIKNHIAQTVAYLALWLLVFLVHRRMLARIRFFSV